MSHRLQRLTLKSEQYSSNPESGQILSLLPEQQRYLLRTLRLIAGDKFIAIITQKEIDGKSTAANRGTWWEAEIINHEQFRLITSLENDRELAINLKLAIGIPKGNGLEDVIRQGTEIGVHEVYPLYTERTILKANTPPSRAKQERWQRIAEEAAELACRPVVPVVHCPQSWNDWLKNHDFDLDANINLTNINLICVTHDHVQHLLSTIQELKQDFNSINEHQVIDSITVLIGPEGGWTLTEETTAITKGFIPVSLGKRILAAVTAPLVALSLISAAFDQSPFELNYELR